MDRLPHLRAVLFWTPIVLLIVSCSSSIEWVTPSEDGITPVPEGEFAFRALDDATLAYRTGNLMVVYLSPKLTEYEKAGRDYEYAAGFRGAAIKLFGKPFFESNLVEEVFDYVVEAKDKQGNTWILTLYHAQLGPAIGGDPQDKTIIPAAKALLELIENTSPADFEASFYDYEIDQTITYGCQDGICYSRTTPGKHILEQP